MTYAEEAEFARRGEIIESQKQRIVELEDDLRDMLDDLMDQACQDMLDDDRKTLTTRCLSSDVATLERLDRYGYVKLLPGGVGRAQKAEIINRSDA